jgi:hypothetical protein
MLYLDGVFWLYATGEGNGSPPQNGGGFDSVLLARSPDGVHFRWHDAPVLLPSGDERDVSQAAVLKEGNRW